MNKREFLGMMASAAVAAPVAALTSQSQKPVPAADNSVSEILRRGTIRAGYVVYPPMLNKDLNTGALSGIFYDLTESAAARLGLKVEWPQETSWATVADDFANGRFDVLGSAAWLNPIHGRGIDFSAPLCYMPMYPIVRADDKRFDDDLSAANDPAVRISSVDGDIGIFIRDVDFPRAKLVTLPNTADYNQLLLDIDANKADMTFLDGDFAARFIDANPGRLKIIKHAVRLYPTTYAVKKGAYGLAGLLNNAVADLVNSGYVEKVLSRHEARPEGYWLLRETFEPYNAAR